jgi:hypothetical protein
VVYARFRKRVVLQHTQFKALPHEASLPAAAIQPIVPGTLNTPEELTQAANVPRYPIVVVMSSQLQNKFFMVFPNRHVAILTAPVMDLVQGVAESLPGGLASNHNPVTTTLAPIMRES